MTVDAGMRAQVFASLKETHGEAIANALMEMLPPAGVPELATKSDVGIVRAEMEVFRSDTKAEFSDVRAEIATLRSETKAGLAALRAEMHEEFKNQTRTFVTWMFSAVALCSTIAGGLGGLIVRLA